MQQFLLKEYLPSWRETGQTGGCLKGVKQNVLKGGKQPAVSRGGETLHPAGKLPVLRK